MDSMKILIIDRDPLTTQLLQSRLVQEGHEVVAEPVRKAALELINHIKFDLILIDPAPLPSVRQVTLPLRWEQRPHYFYIMQTSHAPDPDEIVQSGLNDIVAKPFDWQDLSAKLANAERLTRLMRHLHDTPEIHSDGVLFGKRAMYQLMLSALDRAYRYNEKTFLMTISISNANALKQSDPVGFEALRQSVEKFLSSLHRRSDFLGHLDATDYALLILRPAVSSEPLDAVDRFGIALREFQGGEFQDKFQLNDTASPRPHFLLQLWSLPSAAMVREYHLQE
jgi:PleD family two-component response regulator